MKELAFGSWLECERGMNPHTCTSRASNCRRVEVYEGDLDEHFRNDRMQSLLNRLQYSKRDEIAKAAARHKIPINGSCFNGTATLRSAVKLYAEFCASNAGTQLLLPIRAGAGLEQLSDGTTAAAGPHGMLRLAQTCLCLRSL